MKKEVFIAITVGFILGLIITFGVYRAQTSLKAQVVEPTPTPAQEMTNATPAPSQHSLTITSPEDNDIITQEEIDITGLTSPNSYLTITSTNDEEIFESDDTGNFMSKIKLTGGANLIKVTSINPQGQEASKELTLVFSTADLNNNTKASPSPSPALVKPEKEEDL